MYRIYEPNFMLFHLEQVCHAGHYTESHAFSYVVVLNNRLFELFIFGSKLKFLSRFRRWKIKTILCIVSRMKLKYANQEMYNC